MKHIIRLNGKPIEEATPEELHELDKAIAKSFKEVVGFIIPIDTEYPRSTRVAIEG